MESSIHHQAWNLPFTTKHGIFHSPPSMESSIHHQAWNLPFTTKHGIFHWPPSMGSSIDHQAWNLPFTTKHGIFHSPPSMGSTFTSLLLRFKRRARMIGGGSLSLASEIIFMQSWILVQQVSRGGK
jgi:hypothetical protein